MTNILQLYSDLENYKGLKKQVNDLKLKYDLTRVESMTKLFVCTSSSGEILAFRGVGLTNTSAFDLYSAMSLQGKKSYAGHFLFKNICDYLNRQNILNYDLGGIDKKRNKSVFNFKRGTGSTEINYGDEIVLASFIIKIGISILAWIKFYVSRPN